MLSICSSNYTIQNVRYWILTSAVRTRHWITHLSSAKSIRLHKEFSMLPKTYKGPGMAGTTNRSRTLLVGSFSLGNNSLQFFAETSNERLSRDFQTNCFATRKTSKPEYYQPRLQGHWDAPEQLLSAEIFLPDLRLTNFNAGLLLELNVMWNMHRVEATECSVSLVIALCGGKT